MKIKDFCTFAPKSKIKAGQAIKDGQYMFFTSSKDENKRYIDYLYDGEAIIMGTGGNAMPRCIITKGNTRSQRIVLS